MIIISILGLLFKRRMKFDDIFNDKGKIKNGCELEMILKLLKPIVWYILISLMYHSIQQPIDANTIGFDGSWPLDSFGFCIDKMCDLARTALQYRMSIKWR